MLGNPFSSYNVIKWGKSVFKHPSTSRSMSQKIMIIIPKHRKFHPLYIVIETNYTFDIAIKNTGENLEPPPWLAWQHEVNNVLLYQRDCKGTFK
jgi:hypothetical protein